MSDRNILPSSVETVKTRIERLLPDRSDRQVVLKSLAESAREAHRLMPNAWGITLEDNFFRLNLGMVNTFIGDADRISLLVEKEGALQVAAKSGVGDVQERAYANAPGCAIVVSSLASSPSLFASFHDSHFRALSLVRKRGGYSWRESHSLEFVEYLAMYDSRIEQPLYVTDERLSEEVVSANEEHSERVSTAGAEEGSRRLGLHEEIERDRGLVEEAKRAWARIDPGLPCAVCAFSFSDHYGTLGDAFVEAHHRTPLAELDGEPRKNTVEDLVPVCANCHRMLHRGEGLSVKLLSERIRQSGLPTG